MIYHLHSLVNNVRVRIKVWLADNDVYIPTATVLWNGANWMERETYDFFGVIFDGHPDLRRILNVCSSDAPRTNISRGWTSPLRQCGMPEPTDNLFGWWFVERSRALVRDFKSSLLLALGLRTR